MISARKFPSPPAVPESPLSPGTEKAEVVGRMQWCGPVIPATQEAGTEEQAQGQSGQYRDPGTRDEKGGEAPGNLVALKCSVDLEIERDFLKPGTRSQVPFC